MASDNKQACVKELTAVGGARLDGDDNNDDDDDGDVPVLWPLSGTRDSITHRRSVACRCSLTVIHVEFLVSTSAAVGPGSLPLCEMISLRAGGMGGVENKQTQQKPISAIATSRWAFSVFPSKTKTR